MTAQQMFTIKVKPRSWRCTCGQRLGLRSQYASVRTADDHADWHSRRGDLTCLELGALTREQVKA